MITNAKYMQNPRGENTCVKVTKDSMSKFVPLDDNNKDYKELLEWVAEGNTIEAAE
jgi:hypothetical protein